MSALQLVDLSIDLVPDIRNLQDVQSNAEARMVFMQSAHKVSQSDMDETCSVLKQAFEELLRKKAIQRHPDIVQSHVALLTGRSEGAETTHEVQQEIETVAPTNVYTKTKFPLPPLDELIETTAARINRVCLATRVRQCQVIGQSLAIHIARETNSGLLRVSAWAKLRNDLKEYVDNQHIEFLEDVVQAAQARLQEIRKVFAKRLKRMMLGWVAKDYPSLDATAPDLLRCHEIAKKLEEYICDTDTWKVKYPVRISPQTVQAQLCMTREKYGNTASSSRETPDINASTEVLVQRAYRECVSKLRELNVERDTARIKRLLNDSRRTRLEYISDPLNAALYVRDFEILWTHMMDWELQKCRELRNNMARVEPTLDNFASRFISAVPFVLHASLQIPQRVRTFHKYARGLYSLFEPDCALDNFCVPEFIEELLSEDPELELHMDSQQEARDLLAIICFETLSTAKDGGGAAFVPFGSRKTNFDYFSIRSEDNVKFIGLWMSTNTGSRDRVKQASGASIASN